MVVVGQLDVHFIAAKETVGRQTHHGVLVDVESGHRLWCSLSEASCSILKSEFALDGLWAGDIREQVALQHDLGTALVGTRIG